MFQNGQTDFENLPAFAARFVKYVWPFWVIVHERINIQIYHLNESPGFPLFFDKLFCEL